SPGFMRRYFPDGVNASSLAKAPALTFNRKDRLQTQWVHRLCRRPVDTPTHWLPSTQAFANASAAGIGWGMNPVPPGREQLKSGCAGGVGAGTGLAGAAVLAAPPPADSDARSIDPCCRERRTQRSDPFLVGGGDQHRPVGVQVRKRLLQMLDLRQIVDDDVG